MLPMAAAEAVPERGQQLLCWVIAPYAGCAPALGGTEEESSAPAQTKKPEESSPAEPLVKIKLGEDETEIECLIDTGATYSVLNTKKHELGYDTVRIIGATGKPETRPFFKPLKFKIGKQWVTHQFLYLPGAPKPLIGRDLLEKLEAEIKFKNGEVEVSIPESKFVQASILLLQEIEQVKRKIPAEVEDAVIPVVWAGEIPGKSKRAEPVRIDLIPGSTPVRLKQYPLKLEAKLGLVPIIQKFLKYGLLRECESKYNTPILPVKKADGKSYRLVQDLRAVNQIVQDIHPVVANPYTLLTALTEDQGWFTVLDLKDAFFCVPLDSGSQELFAFEWENPETGRKTQYTWTVLPQGFKNSPTIFGNQLAKELELWRQENRNGVMLQYVDDILIAGNSREECLELTVSLLNFLGLSGYRVSKGKAQIAQETVIYLGFEILRGQRQLSNERKEAICQLPEPRNVHELRTFLGMVGWCRLWIANYGLMVKPLYELLKSSKGPLQWTNEDRNAYIQLKRALMKAPALGLPNLEKPFELFTHERQAIALGVLTQRLGEYKRAVAYFSKQLDPVSQGWPSCLRAVAATVLLIQEARKLTMGQKITVYVPHMVTTVLDQKGGHWLSPSRMLKYQVVLIEPDDVTLKTTAVINPAMFLSTRQEGGKPEHDCLQTIEEVYSSRPDLKDVPLQNPDWELYTDGSSFMKEGKRVSGYAITTVETVVEAQALPSKTSAQKAELIALTRALQLSANKCVNIWTDSKYAFGVVHAHGAIWKERGLLSSQGTEIKHKEEILSLLESIKAPAAVAIMHCKAHQSGQTAQERGNKLADLAAKRAAEKGIEENVLAIVPGKRISLQENPIYDKQDKRLIETLQAERREDGWAVTPTGLVVIPHSLMNSLVKEEHNTVHWGTENLLKHLQKSVISRNMVEIIKSITQRCELCCKNNPKTQNKIQFGKTTEGQAPGEYWQIDFTELPRKGGLKYLLVLVDTYTGWPEAFPCRTNKAKEVVKILLKEIIPRFGVPLGMSSDRGPHFIAKVVTEISRLLGISWDLHTPYRPQSSGKVKRMNYTLKTPLSKICQETSMNWTQALPLALLRIKSNHKVDNISACTN
ncbi:PREDICTED: protein NYNRIN-like [Pygoscelis adeliae]|nr:PREDICTED: protein NYNRIN-like [Pygoscelis adeliae]